jgi:hypothetical protein
MTKLNKNFKYFIILILLIFPFVTHGAVSVKGEVPQNAPLQPAPEGQEPNIKGNINFKSTETVESADSEDQGLQASEENSDSKDPNSTQGDLIKENKNSGLTGVLLFLIFGAILGYAYFRTFRKKG